MNSKNSLTAVLGFVILAGVLTMIASHQVQGQGSTKDVFVINNQEQPVPTLPMGTAQIAGTVNVENLPLDAAGNLRTSTAQTSTQFEFMVFFTLPILDASSGLSIWRFANILPGNNLQPTDIVADLEALSAQGWELDHVSPLSNGLVVFTLRRPIVP